MGKCSDHIVKWKIQVQTYVELWGCIVKKNSMHIKGLELYTEIIKNTSPSGKKVICRI